VLAADCTLEMSAQTALVPVVVEVAAEVLLELLLPPQPAMSDAVSAAMTVGRAMAWRTGFPSTVRGPYPTLVNAAQPQLKTDGQRALDLAPAWVRVGRVHSKTARPRGRRELRGQHERQVFWRASRDRSRPAVRHVGSSFGRVVNPLALVLVLALVGPPTADAARSEFFGISQGSNRLNRLDGQDLKGMAAARVRTERFQLNWPSVQPSQGSFHWNETDALVGSLARHGIRAVPFVWGSPPWVAGTDARPPIDSAADEQAWQNFLKAAVARYGPGGIYWGTIYQQQYGAGATPLPIQSWQIWNEPNLAKYFAPQPSATEYARVLEISHDAIKSQDPEATIVLAGLVGIGSNPSWVFFRNLYQVAGVKSNFDVAALHPYSPDLDTFRKAIQNVRGVMTQYGDAEKTLWLTEVGWGSGPPDQYGINKGITGQDQMLDGAFDMILHSRRTWKVERVFWFYWRDPSTPAGTCSFCGTAGLLNYDRTPKPAYDTFTGYTAETTPPQASITAGPSSGGFTNDSTPTFSFASNEPGSTFQCHFDAQAFATCAPPFTRPSPLSDGPHAFFVKAIDASGNESAVVSRSFTVDTIPPSTTAPGQGLSLHTQLGKTTVPVRLSWSGSDDRTMQANLKFDLQKRTYRSDAWSAWSSMLPNTSLRATTPSLSADARYQFEVRSRDQAGNVSAFKAGSALTPTLRQESAATYTGAWTAEAQTDASGGSVETSSQGGASAIFAFTGRGVGVVMPLRSTLGSVEICLDPGTGSASCASVDLSPPSGVGGRIIVFARSGLSPAVQHHVRIKVLSGRADLDALALVG
jgi:chitodextrinase